jgi:hypothetical protein
MPTDAEFYMNVPAGAATEDNGLCPEYSGAHSADSRTQIEDGTRSGEPHAIVSCYFTKTNKLRGF